MIVNGICSSTIPQDWEFKASTNVSGGILSQELCDRIRHLFGVLLVLLLGVRLRRLGHVVHFASQLAPASAVVRAGGENAAGSTRMRRVLSGVTDLVRHLARLLAEPATATGRQRIRSARRLGRAAEDARHLVRDGAGNAARLLAELAVALAVGTRHNRVVTARGRHAAALECLRHLVRRRVEDLGRGRAEIAVALLVGARRQCVCDAGTGCGGARVAGAKTHGAGVVGLEPLLDGVDDGLVAGHVDGIQSCFGCC
ncbi:hypothetical protein PG996_004111 [Apiospora saccharicola]|uniref:Uncharacterized protein n=1 Tax=Apiospora saccharicola TaxID=335842 RepID=A0ABR1W362_9PEZI